jgi:hypothetical protein
MRFGKKLALAMIRDAGEVPYISQKELKHQLVGLEKLCKVYYDQVEVLRAPACEIDDVLGHISRQRLNYGVQSREGILDITEVKTKDSAFIRILERDIARIRYHARATLAGLMHSLNEILEVLADSRIIIRQDDVNIAKAPANLASLLTNEFQIPIPADSGLAELIAEFNRLTQYIEVNQSAIRKLMQRRFKNVPRCFWCHELHDMEIGMSSEMSKVARSVNSIEQMLAEASGPVHYKVDLRLAT